MRHFTKLHAIISGACVTDMTAVCQHQNVWASGHTVVWGHGSICPSLLDCILEYSSKRYFVILGFKTKTP